MNPGDLGITLTIYGCALLVLELWLLSPRQNRLQKSLANVLRVPIRLAAPIALMHGFTLLFGVPLWKVYAVYGVGDVLFTIFVGFPMPLASAALQWILGWPSFEEWQPENRSILTPAKIAPQATHKTLPNSPPPGEESTLVGCRGVATTTLAPTGKVRVKGYLYAARSGGDYIEKNAPVKVVGQDGFGALTVEPD